MFSENKKLLIILIIIYLMVATSSLTIASKPGLLVLLPFCIVPIVIRVFFDTRLALFVHIVTLILTGFMVPNGFEFIFQQLIAGIIAIISVAELRRRSQFFIAAFAVFVTYSAIYIGMLLIQEGSLAELDKSRFLLFGGSALFTLFSYPIIFLFEKLLAWLPMLPLWSFPIQIRPCSGSYRCMLPVLFSIRCRWLILQKLRFMR
ncbi:MAG: hypothetical protein IPN08_17715 [Bacteroidales bacterium]|nr:hypothetical protein [Bacteroidales bacterium]